MRRFIGTKTKGQINDIVQELKNIDKIIIEDKKIKMGPTLAKVIANVVKERRSMMHVEIIVHTYDDIFEAVEDTLKINILKI